MPARIAAVDPRLSFPVFPDPVGIDGNIIPVLEGGVVHVPFWYWIEITKYVVDVEKTREMYDAWRDIYFQERK